MFVYTWTDVVEWMFIGLILLSGLVTGLIIALDELKTKVKKWWRRGKGEAKC